MSTGREEAETPPEIQHHSEARCRACVNLAANDGGLREAIVDCVLCRWPLLRAIAEKPN